ncbi:MAG: putative Ig domain-containing protein [Gammaproteobacteria bacterium]|nr:putative Ig domain-containing protein [Gammaproteobacteria bacterium]
MAIITGGPSNDLLLGTIAGDQIQAMDGHDVIDGGQGPDILMGGMGNDTYIFRPGDGIDSISEVGGGGFDTVRLAGGYIPANVILLRVNNDLVIQSLITADTITVSGYYDPLNTAAQIEQIVFDDGTTWNTAAIETRVMSNNSNQVTPFNDVIVATNNLSPIDGIAGNDSISGTTGDDVLIGGSGNDALYGYGGNDTLVGGEGNDVLRGGAGNDVLQGGVGNDTYIFASGSGLDDIFEEGGRDTIYLTNTFLDNNDNPVNPYDPATLILQRAGNDLILLEVTTGSRITVHNNFDPTIPDAPGGIERIVFDDGTVWETPQIQTRLNNFNNNSPTTMDDVLLGTAHNDYLAGVGGNDTISGGAGDDQIIGDWGNDRLFGNAGNDLLIGQGGNDQFWGNAGDDTLDGSWGNDTYYFNLGDGHDVITELYNGENNRVVFGEGISLENLRVGQDGSTVLFEVLGSGDSLRVANTYLDPNGPKVVNQFSFAGGMVMSLAQLQTVIRGTEQNDWLIGSPGDDVLLGLDGDDTIFGIQGNDIINGGKGNDTVASGGGNDTYIYNQGDGMDRIAVDSFYQPMPSPGTISGVDTLKFGDGIDPSTVVLQQWGGDLQVWFPSSPGDAVIVEGFFAPMLTDAPLDQIIFADGTVWNTEAITNRALYSNSNWPTPQGDTITGAAVNDFIAGMEGNDTISGGAGDDQIMGDAGNDRLYGGEGNDGLMGGAGNDVLTGGGGNDFLAGDSGSDTYQLNVGDGIDRIWDDDRFGGATGAATDVIKLGDGYDPALLQLQRWGDDLVIKTFNGQDQITLQQQFSTDIDGLTHNAIERIEFTDGTIWDAADITHRVLQNNANWATPQSDTIAGMWLNEAINGGDGNDTISGGGGDDQIMGDLGDDRLFGNAGNDLLQGGDGNDQLWGNRGDDTLEGGVGNDSYYFNLGDGRDVIDEALFNGDTNRLVFGEGIGVQNLRVIQAGPDLVIEIIGTGNIPGMGDGVRLTNTGFDPNGPKALTQFEFADGTVLNLDQLQTIIPGTNQPDYLIGTPGNDTVVGLGGPDYIVGGGGNDTLIGGAGADTYVFNLGDGQDVIIDSESSTLFYGMDSVQFGAGITQAIMTPGRMGNDLVVDFTSGDRITVKDWYTSTTNQIETWSFTDGSVLSAAQLQAWADNLSPQVAQPIAAQSTYEDTPFSFTIPAGTFVDPNATDTLNLNARLAEGSALPGWLSFNATTGTFSGTPANNDVAALSIRVTATDNYGMTAVNDFALSVVNVNDAPTVVNPLSDATSAEGNVFTYVVPSTTFSDVDQGDTLHYSASLSDGSTLPSWINFDATTLTLSGSLVDGNAGVYSIRITATDAANASASDDFNLTVADTLATTFTGSSANDTLNGTAFMDVINGLAGSDSLYGYAGNDTLDGGSGPDTMYGGTGDDTYSVNSGGDSVIENLNEGIDTVKSAVSYTLSDNVENLTLTGNASINAYGNALDNRLMGNSANNTLTGNAGNDWLDGGTGSDSMRGGSGDDTYVVSSNGDVVIENANDGIDTVRTSISYTLGNNVENLVLTGAGNLSGSGNGLSNSILGNSASNTLTGNAGNDTLQGLGGNDVLRGGTGNDTYLFGRGDGNDTLVENDTTPGNTDTAAFSVNPLDLVFNQNGANLTIALHGGTDTLTVQNWYGGAQSQTEVFNSANGSHLSNTQVDQLIQAMAGFSASHGGIRWDQAIDQTPNEVQAVLAAYWQVPPAA